jgi:predicted PurR-regulated permease PerM
MVDVRPRLVALLSALGLVPVVYYMQGTGRPVVWAAIVCVLLITGSLVLIFGPAEDPTAH